MTANMEKESLPEPTRTGAEELTNSTTEAHASNVTSTENHKASPEATTAPAMESKAVATVETVAQPAISRRRFMDLSVDIKTLIVQYIIRPTDMKSLCLTSKQLHAITARQLYQKVTLDIGGPDDNKLGAFLNPANIGLPHIRELDLYLANMPDKCDNLMSQAHFAVRMILELLPENILEHFSWHPWNSFLGDNLVLLYKKQKRLKWMEAIALDRNVLSEVEKLPNFQDRFQHVRKLGLYPDSRDVLNFAGMLIKNSGQKLEKITLHASWDDTEPPIPGRELNDSVTGPGLITTSLFGHMQPFEKCKPLALKDLTLQKINLRHAADYYCKVIDFTTLKALRVYNCSGADAIFSELCRSSRLPNKLEVLETKVDDNREKDYSTALDGFLKLVSGIKVLVIDVCFAEQLPDTAGITRHHRTLRELNVHAGKGDSEDDEMVYSVEDFTKICKECTGLEQLSCAFPPTNLLSGNSDEFIAFETALGELPNLVTLNITTWPTTDPNTRRLPRKIYSHLLQSLAQAGFERSIQHATSATPPRSSKLSIIAFGASDKVYDREDSKNQIIFAKGKSMNPGVGDGAMGSKAGQGVLAIEVGWCLRRYVQPRSEVLDFNLCRSVRPPVGRESGSEDSD